MQAQNQLEKFIYGLLERLRSEGYSIGTDTYLQTIQLFHWFIDKKKAENLSAFADYLSPLICKNEEEQAKFKVIYREYLARNSNPITELFDQGVVLQSAVREYILTRWIVTAALIICVACAWITYRPYEPLRNDDSFFQEPRPVARGGSISLFPTGIFSKSSDTNYFEIDKLVYSSGQKSVGLSSQPRFDRYGRDTLALHVRSEKFKKDTTYIFPNILVAPNEEIRIVAEPERGIVGEEVKFTAINLDTSGLFPYNWYVKEEKVGNGNPLFHTFDTPYSSEGLTIEVAYDEVDTFLQLLPGSFKSAILEYQVNDKALHLTNKFFEPEQKFISRPQLGWLGGFLIAIVGLLVSAYSASRKKKARVRRKNSKEEFKGDQPPYDIRFLSRDQAVLNNHTLLRIANELKKRTESPSLFLNIPRTIRQSISNLGFFSPSLSQNHVQREYLFLIDHDYVNSQQAKLFTYLVKYFARHSVRINLYYFNQVPEQFYSAPGCPKIPLSTVRDLHHDATLIILSDGSGFVNYTKPDFRDNLAKNFSPWQTRILVTPLSVNDWSGHEKLLASLFQVLPADTIGLRELVGVMEGDVKINAQYIHEKLLTYPSKFIDVESAESLRSYLDGDEELFQWLCVMAIHPKFYWEFFLEMGPLIVKNRSKINYDQLLKLTRISWVHEGRIPPHVRLMLLKELTVDHELLARSTFLHLLDELPDNEREFSYEEKQLSRYTNSFVLSASGRDEFKSDQKILDGEARFLELYKEGQLFDNPFLIYAENNQTNTGGWETPIRTERGNVGIDEYMESQTGQNHPDLKFKQLTQLRIGGLITAALVLTVLVLTMIFYPSAIANNDINNIVPLVRTEVSIDQILMMSFLPIECPDSTNTNDLVRVEVSFGSETLDVTSGKSQDTLYGSIPIGRASKVELGQLSYTVFFQGNQYTEPIEPIAGRYEMKLTGNCLTDRSIIVNYAPGFEEDTSKVLKLSRSFNYNFQVNYPSIPGEYPQSHQFAYTDNIDRDEAFRFVSALVNAGLPIDEVRKQIVSADARENKQFYISGDGNSDVKPPLSIDSLKCLLFPDSCKAKPVSSFYIRTYYDYSNGDIFSMDKRFSSYIFRKYPNASYKSFGEPTSGEAYEDRIIIFRNDIPKLQQELIQCLKAAFPNKTFSVVNEFINDNIIAADIYLATKLEYLKPDIEIETIGTNDQNNANLFKKLIGGDDYNVASIQQAAFGQKPGIIYYHKSKSRWALEIEKLYNGLFPDDKLRAELATSPAGSRRNIITVRMLLNDPPPIEPTYEIRNPKVDTRETDGAFGREHRISGTFDINVSNSIATSSSNSSGTICIDGLQDACTTFNANNANGTQPISFVIGVPGQTEGNFKVVVTHKEFDINEGIGTISLKRLQDLPVNNICDTFNLYVGKVNGNILFRDKEYLNESSSKWGISIRILKSSEKVAYLSLIKTRCEAETIEMRPGERRDITLCDGTRLNFHLLDIGIRNVYEEIDIPRGPKQLRERTKTKSVEIIFDAIICKRPASGN